MSEEKETICADCGLCCDGTLYQYGSFGFEDDPKEWSKLNIVDKNQRRGIELPCPYLDGCKCSIYFEKKPEACSTYICRLARLHKRGTVPEEKAKKVIARVKELKDDFEREFNEFYVYNNDCSIRQNVANLTKMIGGNDELKTFMVDHEDFAASFRLLRKVIKNQFLVKQNPEESKDKK